MSHQTRLVNAQGALVFDLVPFCEAERLRADFVQRFLHQPPVSIEWRAIGESFLHEEGLMTAVINSLFLDRRAEEGDPLPAHIENRRGWAGDAIFNEAHGSKLWLLAYIGKQAEFAADDDLRFWARTWARDALAWLVEDGLCTRIEVEASYPRAGALALLVKLYRQDSLIFREQWERFLNETRNTNA